MRPDSIQLRLFGLLTIIAVCMLIVCSGGGGSASSDAPSTTTTPTPPPPPGAPTPPQALVELVVAPEGKATNPGTQDAPTTLEGARDLLRAHVRSTPGILRVRLRGGLYPRTSTFELGAQDSGSADNPIEYVATPGETPRLIGGAVLDPASLQPVDSSDPNYSRLAPEAVAHLRVADLAAYTADLGTFDSRVNNSDATNQAAELFVDGAPMTLARYPDAVDPETVTLAKRNITLQVSGSSTPDVTGSYAYVGDDALGRPYYQQKKGGDTWTIAAEAKGPYYYLSNRKDLGGTGPEAKWGSVWGLDGPSGRFPSAGGTAMGDLLIEPADESPALPGFMLIRSTDGETALELTNPSARLWAKPGEALLYGYSYHSWSATHMKAASYAPATGHAVLSTKPPYGIRIGQPVFAYNVLEELTIPGEYFIDRSLNRLYLYPSGIPSELLLSRLQAPLLRLKDAARLTFQGLTFEATKDLLVDAPTSTSVSFQACTFRNAGGKGVRLGGSQNLVDGCTLSGLGKAGIHAWGGNRYTLTPSGTSIQNCDIHHIARLFWVYQPAVRVTSGTTSTEADCVGLIIANNALHHLPHEAIEFLGNDHQILRNYIHNTCQWSSDSGAIYTGRDWGTQGNLIRNNLFRLNGGPMGAHVASVYLDGGAAGITVEANIFYRSTSWAGIQHGGGRDVFMRYNIFVGHWVGIVVGNYAASYITNQPGSSWNFLEKIQRFNYQLPPWSLRYPTLAAIPSDWGQIENSHWLQPEGCVVYGNLQYGFLPSLLNQGRDGWAVKWFKQVEQNLEGVDPRITNSENGDFSLRADSPMKSVPGFPGIDTSQIGPQK